MHKQFQLNTVDGGTDVHFNLEFDGQKSSVTNIQIHSNFDNKLPTSAYLEFDSKVNEWTLCRYYEKEDSNKNIIRHQEWLVSPLAREITKEIVKIWQEQTPTFAC